MIRKFLKKKSKRNIELHETLVDYASDKYFSFDRAEGRLIRPISSASIIIIATIMISFIFILLGRVWYLQILEGERYRDISDNNSFSREIVFAKRGLIKDRNGVELAWNKFNPEEVFEERAYIGEGFSNLLGYVGYPKKDKTGNYFRNNIDGISGIENAFNSQLQGENGAIVIETDALGEKIAERFIESDKDGNDIVLSIDSDVQKFMYDAISFIAKERDFLGGTGAMMDIKTGELISLVSYPDYDSNAFVNGDIEIEKYLQDKSGILVNRAVSGLYTPGSTIKPFFAIAAIEEEIVEPNRTIVSNGFITIRSPYDKSVEYVFKDWKAHGAINLYEAIAVSSNVYFYHVGGGFADVEGLGIDRIYRFARLFGLEQPTETGLGLEPEGIIPNPEWKENRFGENWNIGDTYNTVIGQYGFQITPLQLLRGIASIANNGVMVSPHLRLNESGYSRKLVASDESIDVAKRGMRLTVTDGTAKLLNIPELEIAAKTGTAQIGNKGLINSLLVSFFPYSDPKYAFIIIMERGEVDAAIAASRRFLDGIREIEKYR